MLIWCELKVIYERRCASPRTNLGYLSPLGEILLKQTHTASADSAFAQALLLGNSINIAALIAHIYSEQNHAKRAIEYYEHAIERAPENARLLNNLAWSYAETGIELERATRLSLRSLQLDGENPVYMDTYAELLVFAEALCARLCRHTARFRYRKPRAERI